MKLSHFGYENRLAVIASIDIISSLILRQWGLGINRTEHGKKFWLADFRLSVEGCGLYGWRKICCDDWYSF
jgi:hypothetical protein